jgi:uncharacterized protein
LLADVDWIAETVAALRAALPAGTAAQLLLQTNGVLLTEARLDVLRGCGIRIGVSVDGPAAEHDLNRSYADGRGSFAEVDRALRLLGDSGYRSGFAGILAVVDPRTDPVACYEGLLEYRPPALDFLLPHANWSAPPPAGKPGERSFGDWLVRLFDRWYDAPIQEAEIPFFDQIVESVLGDTSSSESIGLGQAAMVVIETDGEIEQVDSLKSAYEGAAATGLSVYSSSLDAALEHPGIIARQIGIAALSDSCGRCDIRGICGGGLYSHRYRAGSGFRNPSVYCVDLSIVIGHIMKRVREDSAARQRGRT